MKVAQVSGAAGHGHGVKVGGFMTPYDNTPPKVVSPSKSGRIDHSTPRHGVGSSDPDNCALSIQASNIFFTTDDGICHKQVNPFKKDQEDQYQSRSSGPTRDNHPDQVLEPDQRYWQNTTNDYIDDLVDFGDEVSSPIASATTIFWKKALSNISFEHEMELGKIPSNSQFLQHKGKNVI